MELEAIAAVVLGGASLFDGHGDGLGTLFIVTLIQLLRNIFDLVGLGSFYYMKIGGLIIIAAILFNHVIDSRQGRG